MDRLRNIFADGSLLGQTAFFHSKPCRKLYGAENGSFVSGRCTKTSQRNGMLFAGNFSARCRYCRRENLFGIRHGNYRGSKRLASRFQRIDFCSKKGLFERKLGQYVKEKRCHGDDFGSFQALVWTTLFFACQTVSQTDRPLSVGSIGRNSGAQPPLGEMPDMRLHRHGPFDRNFDFRAFSLDSFSMQQFLSRDECPDFFCLAVFQSNFKFPGRTVFVMQKFVRFFVIFEVFFFGVPIETLTKGKRDVRD